MINNLKATLLPYVREATDLEIWIDEGSSESIGATLYIDQLIVINVVELKRPWRDLLAAVQFWYNEHNCHSTEEEHKSGLTFDVIPFREDDVGMQVRLKMREKVITTEREGLIDAIPCEC